VVVAVAAAAAVVVGVTKGVREGATEEGGGRDALER
jgi:hypothetical protein